MEIIDTLKEFIKDPMAFVRVDRITELGDREDCVDDRLFAALTAAIAALSKQVPMKPVKHKYKVVHNDEADKYLDHADSFYACPNCLNLVDKQDSYCRYCGKKITGGNDLW